MTETRDRGPVKVTFVSGRERGFKYPRAIEQAGLTHRLAVVQHTFLPTCVDMVFDEALWRELGAFLTLHSSGEVLVGREVGDLGKREAALAAFMSVWERTPAADREPPGLLLVRNGGRLCLCIVTEYWARVGGPDRYHDSYTYSVFSDADLSESLPAFLRARSAGRWDVSREVA